ncbi:unnamed protein product, partial [Laminaria digitata]
MHAHVACLPGTTPHSVHTAAPSPRTHTVHTAVPSPCPQPVHTAVHCGSTYDPLVGEADDTNLSPPSRPPTTEQFPESPSNSSFINDQPSAHSLPLSARDLRSIRRAARARTRNNPQPPLSVPEAFQDITASNRAPLTISTDTQASLATINSSEASALDVLTHSKETSESTFAPGLRRTMIDREICTHQLADTSSTLPLCPFPTVTLPRPPLCRAGIPPTSLLPNIHYPPIPATPSDPMEHEVDYSGSEADDVPLGGGDQEASQSSPPPGSSPVSAQLLPAIPAVYVDSIKPAEWAALAPALRDSLAANAPNTVRRVHALDEEALLLQHKLEDEETQEALQTATARRTSGRKRMSALETSQAKLRQQLASMDRE